MSGDLICGFPRYLVLPILIDFLDENARELTRLDSALCNKTGRVIFLGLISGENIKFKGDLSKVSETGFLKWIGVKNIKITNLVLSSEHLVDCIKDVLGSMSQLQVLVIHLDSIGCSQAFLTLIKHCPTIREIHFSRCEVLTNRVLAALTRHCGQLCKVFLPGYSDKQIVYDNQTMVTFLSACKNLDELCLRNVQFTKEMFTSISGHCELLQSLTLANQKDYWITPARFVDICLDDDWTALGSHLLVLRIINTRTLTQHVLDAICAGCKVLKVLDISHSTSLQLHHALKAIGTAPCNTHLTELNVSFIPTGVGSVSTCRLLVSALFTNCVKLTAFYVKTRFFGGEDVRVFRVEDIPANRQLTLCADWNEMLGKTDNDVAYPHQERALTWTRELDRLHGIILIHDPPELFASEMTEN
jgi:hypothetical protein